MTTPESDNHTPSTILNFGPIFSTKTVSESPRRPLSPCHTFIGICCGRITPRLCKQMAPGIGNKRAQHLRQARASQAAKKRKVEEDNYLPQSVLQFLNVEEEQQGGPGNLRRPRYSNPLSLTGKIFQSLEKINSTAIEQRTPRRKYLKRKWR